MLQFLTGALFFHAPATWLQESSLDIEISLGASIAPHAPPSGFSETYFFLICGTQKEDFDMFPRKKSGTEYIFNIFERTASNYLKIPLLRPDNNSTL